MQSSWFWASALLMASGAITIFLPVMVAVAPFRLIFGFILSFILPGYLVIKAAFPGNLPLKNLSKDHMIVGRALFIVALDVTITPLLASILNYSLWGINTISLTITIIFINIIFAALALVRQYGQISKRRSGR